MTVFLSAVALSLPEPALAEAASSEDIALPPVSVQRPKQVQKKRAQTKRVAPRAPAPQLPAPQAPVASAERGTGPVNGIVAHQSVSGTKTDTPIVETPQAISVVTADEIRQHSAQNVSEALRYTPGVFVEPQGASSRYEDIRIRGFEPLTFLDGLRVPRVQWWATPRIEAYGLERVEVLKGPASVIYGQTGPGGLLNLISKRPTDYAFREIELQTGSYDRLQGAFDIGGPLDKDRQFLYRLTGLIRDSDTQVDFTKDKRLFIAPAFTWRPNVDTTFTVLANYGEDKGTYPHQYVPAEGSRYFNPNGRISRHTFLGEPGFDNFQRNQFGVGYAFEHRFNDVWSVRQNLRYAGIDMSFDALRSEGLLDANEDGVPDDWRTLRRSANSLAADARNFTVDNQAQADFVTGQLKHKLLLGVDYQWMNGDYDFRYGPASSIDIFAPVYGSPVSTPTTQAGWLTETQTQLGLYVQDQIKLDRWILTLGARQDFANTKTNDKLRSTVAQRDDGAFTYRVGLGYEFDNGVVPYVSYATSFQPTLAFDAAGRQFKPTTGDQIEAGVKYQPPGYNMLLTAAVFDITQQNVVSSIPNTIFSTQTGEVRVRGFELEAKAELMPGLDVTAAYAFLDSEVTKSNNPLEIGRPNTLTPRHEASAWVNYRVQAGALAGVRVAAGVRHVGEVFGEVSSDFPVSAPAYTVFDAAVGYDFAALRPDLRGLRLDIDFKNIGDKYYVTYCYQTAFCSLAAGRTVLATLRYRWDEPRAIATRY
jgi:iron complex outermembrane receptor protein